MVVKTKPQLGMLIYPQNGSINFQGDYIKYTRMRVFWYFISQFYLFDPIVELQMENIASTPKLSAFI